MHHSFVKIFFPLCCSSLVYDVFFLVVWCLFFLIFLQYLRLLLLHSFRKTFFVPITYPIILVSTAVSACLSLPSFKHTHTHLSLSQRRGGGGGGIKDKISLPRRSHIHTLTHNSHTHSPHTLSSQCGVH